MKFKYVKRITKDKWGNKEYDVLQVGRSKTIFGITFLLHDSFLGSYDKGPKWTMLRRTDKFITFEQAKKIYFE